LFKPACCTYFNLLCRSIEQPKLKDVNTATRTGETAFWWAARSNQPEMMALLLEAKADINKAPGTGWTPLMAAVRCKLRFTLFPTA
jgi:ankyrin repeat protein